MPEINMTTSAITSFSETSSWFSLIVIIGICAVLISLATMMLGSYRFYYKGRKFLDFIVNSVYYFVWGIGFILCLFVPAIVVYSFMDQARKGNTVPIWMTGLVISGYCIISLLGWFFKKYIFERVKFFELQYNPDLLNKDENVTP